VFSVSASVGTRSFAAGFVQLPSFPAAVDRLKDVNVIFNEDLFDQIVLRVLFESFGQCHCTFPEIGQNPVSGMRHNASPDHNAIAFQDSPDKARNETKQCAQKCKVEA
jgi:hypothetical protein